MLTRARMSCAPICSGNPCVDTLAGGCYIPRMSEQQPGEYWVSGIERARRVGARLSPFSPFVLLAIFALLYLLTLDDGLRPGELQGGDLITHQYAQVQARPSNAPGYPLYTLGGWLWFRLGRLIFGSHANPIPILSSYSTLWALVALWLLYQVILETTRCSVILRPHAGTSGMRQRKKLPIVMLSGSTTQSTLRRATSEASVRREFLSSAAQQSEKSQASVGVGQPMKKQPGLEALAGLVVSGRNRLKPRIQSGGALLPGQGDIRRDGGNWPIAALVTAFYGVTYFFWYYAVTTEQYTSAVAYTLAVLLLAFRWERTRQDRALLVIAFLAGVGLAHMLTVLFIIPPLLWFVLRAEPKLLRRPRLIATAVALAALPLLGYLYVYARGAAHPEWRGVGQWANAGQWFWSFISTQQGRDELTWSLAPFFTREFPSQIWGELTVPGLVAGLIGLAALGRRRALVLYATLAIYVVFCWIDRLGNWYQVIMPAYALVAVGIAATMDHAMRRVTDDERRTTDDERRTTDDERRTTNDERRTTDDGRNTQYAVRAALILTLIALIAYRGALSFPRANSHGRADDTGLAPGWAILADDPAPGTAVLGTLDETLALNYLTEIWGERPDVRSVTSGQARAVLAQGGPLAVTEAALPLVPAEISPASHYSALGRTLVAVSAAPAAGWPMGARSGDRPQQSADLRPWTHDFGPALRLAGGRVARNAATQETVVLLTWEARAKPAEDWSVSVRLTQGGQEIAQLDRQHPVAGAYPTSAWAPGEVIGDAYPFILPPGAAADGVTVILYRRAADGGFVNLDVARFPIN